LDLDLNNCPEVGPSHFFNAAIAIIEGRTEVAKDILRQSDLDIPLIVQRLRSSAQGYADAEVASTIRAVLMDALTLVPETGKDTFYYGVAALEALLEERLP
jgi:hypothetical protein